ncbi:bifunctional phosphopantothenoylcysteine decarboxylase/phosphopantothenate--cysteine ligase CoaBC [Kordiimonas sp. SCSIO 12603]|uniref:bifunctional phosphopantothenoylcysteine decarboxylase/phosphopantothenate--cysteine ligase CoaBC n=1 Tax=Kordiimonas sp. SCSIO 12603 TaxID=2829596 RepID=UPI00210335CC|nr:bifunctional phosphopantothenoylcysteine decarboxylase/phosphopantothenate--cysteine ligase CoaBC [Kordiimonas sp. SCSIO 12603]UTW58717.1 bifunctional phosphopantothenoylcysteine decarboxylase/phosphopantothenate--cysteine ligase CoaBC [Kordiimonas sp. SCSIO 12603]
MLNGKRILLIIGGGVAAYKALDLARRLMERGAHVRGVLTKGGQEFITPLSVASLTGEECYTELFSLKDEAEMGHIRLSREADLILVAPATADLMGKMAGGLANDLASTVLLATDKPVMVAPAMNAQMWEHPATKRNVATLKGDGVHFIEPGEGMLACGEVGAGRLAEVPDMVEAVDQFFSSAPQPLSGKHIIVTAGPTHEPIDPVRYIANRSSGKQGFEIAGALAALGAKVSLVAGPVNQPTPKGVNRIDVETALEMKDAVEASLPADSAVCVAAVADWRVENGGKTKLKKSVNGLPELALAENPDILKTISNLNGNRPQLVVGFAAETNNVLEYAAAKRERKGCDLIVANDVSDATGIMGGDHNEVHLVTGSGVESWPSMAKADVAGKLAQKIADLLG